MTLINRQQFMSELSKLLTFMFKEDRSEIIQQYNEMLDNAEDEQAMLESFGSPTRLAVAISRSYQRDERKLSVHADSKDGGSGENVKVKPVIPTQGKKSSAPIVKPNEPAADAYVDIIEEIRREKAAEEGIEYKPIFFKEDPKPEPAAEPDVEESAEEAAEETAQPVDAVSENAAEEAGTADEENAENDSEASDSEAQAEDADAEAAETAEQPAGEAEDAPQAQEAQADEGGEAEAEAAAEVAEPADETAHVLATVFNETPETAPEKVRKTNVFALILYIIVSIPVGLVLLLVMLGLELGVLGCGLLGLRVGFGLLSFTFSGMSVLADVLICFGVNIAVLALGVLVTWLAVWLIIVSVPWLIRGIKNLGRKLCVKEVEIDG